jgi:hypothetical protein
MEYKIPSSLVLVMRFDYKSKALGKGPVLQMLEGYVGVGNDDVMSRLLTVGCENSFNCHCNLASQLHGNCRRFWRFGGLDVRIEG